MEADKRGLVVIVYMLEKNTKRNVDFILNIIIVNTNNNHSTSRIFRYFTPADAIVCFVFISV